MYSGLYHNNRTYVLNMHYVKLTHAGFDDAVITAYDVCSAVAECVTSGGALRNEIPLLEDIERIASQVDMISFIHGSCILIKK